MNIPETFRELLAWVLSPAGAWLLGGLAVSLGLEKFAFWQAWQNPGGKKLVTALIALGLAGIAHWVNLNPEWIAVVEPTYQFVAKYLLAWLTLEGVHAGNKRLQRRAGDAK